MRKYLFSLIGIVIPTIISAQDYFTSGSFEFYEFEPNKLTCAPINRDVAGRIVIPSSMLNKKTGKKYTVTSLGAFRWCKNITEVVLPSTLKNTNINFADCTSLEKVELPESIDEISPYAFSNCVNLKDINLQHIKVIRYNAFAGCTSLQNLPISNITNIEAIETYAFEKCKALNKVELPNTLIFLGDGAFCDCTNLEYITLSESLQVIGKSIFYNCTNLREIVIPNSVKSIGDNAFYNCTNLKEIVIPDSVKTIGDYAFRKCTSLTSVTFGCNLKTLGGSAFTFCPSLKTLYFRCATPPYLGAGFYNRNNSGVTVYVPKSSLQAYISIKSTSNYRPYKFKRIIGY